MTSPCPGCGSLGDERLTDLDLVRGLGRDHTYYQAGRYWCWECWRARTQPCAGCSEPDGGRYKYGSAEFCWPCWMERSGIGPLPAILPASDPPWAIFRRGIIRALVAIDQQRFVYINENRVIGACPLCLDGTVRVDFLGTTPRADLACNLGCAEHEVAEALGRSRKARR
jgi:hypothetical protein